MFALPLIAAVVAFQAAPEKPTPETVHPYQIKAEYNRVRDYTSTGVDLGVVAEGRKDDRDARWTLDVSHVSPGEARAPLGDSASVGFTFLRVGDERRLDDFRSVAILADAFRARPEPDYKSERLETGRVIESVWWPLTFAEFRKLAAASDVEISVGSCDVRLTPRQVAALKDLAARLAVDDAAASKLALEHLTLLRKREADLKAAAEKAVEKAKAAVDKLPPARRKAEANRVGMRVFMEEFADTSARYRPTDEEAAQIMRDFPILSDAAVELMRAGDGKPGR